MAPAFADVLLALLALHAGCGALFAIAFHWRGIGRIDTAGPAGTFGFRILVTPGVIALWPFLAQRWWAASRAGADA